MAWDWRNGGSCWKVITLTEEQVAELKANLDAPKRLAAMKKLVATAEEKIADGYTYSGYNADGSKSEFANSGSLEVDGLVTDPSQLASEAQEPSEGPIEGLVDGDISTFFHTAWSVSYDGTHYLQFSIEQPEEALLLKWVKRKCANFNNGAPLAYDLYATNDEALLDVVAGAYTNEDGEDVEDYDYWLTQWTKVGSEVFKYKYTTGVGQSTTDLDAAVSFIDFDGAYKYFRLLPTSRLSGSNAYIYGAEFRVYRGAFDPEASLINAVPDDVLKALLDAIALAKEEIEDEAATAETLAALEKAYADFLEHYPDPNRITTALAAAKALAESAEEGSGLGYYANGSIAKLNAVIADVESKVKELMTTEEIQNLLAELNAALDAFAASLNVPTNGIYVIKSKTSTAALEGCSIVATTSSEKWNVELLGRVKSGDAYADEANAELRAGRYWNVEKVDGGYTYRNLYTGMYLCPVGPESEAIAQSVEPYVFAIQFAKEPGCFNLVLDVKDAKNGEYIYANAQPASSKLVTWTSASGRDNSAFEFIPADAATINDNLDNSGLLFNVEYPEGIQIFTFPVDMDAYVEGNAGQFYTVLGQSANNDVQLNAVAEGTTLKAGQGYVYIPTVADKVARFYMPEGTAFTELKPVRTALSENGLCGTFEEVTLPDNCGVFNAKHTEIFVSEKGEKVAPNTGWFELMPVATATGDVTVKANGKITAEDANSIITIVDNRKSNLIYSISGVRMNRADNLPAGLYIINGKKYIVK